MNKVFDSAVPYMEVGKCYNYTLLKTEKPVVYRFYVANVIPQKIIGKDEIYNYGYFCIFPYDKSEIMDSMLYIWNTVGGQVSHNYWSVKFCKVEEMSPEDAADFVSNLKNKTARKIYLKES